MDDITVRLMQISAMIIGTICVIGNALVCHVIVRLKSMKTSMNYVILNLAILDAMTGFFGICFVITSDSNGVLGPPVLQQAYNQSTTLAEVLCKVEWSYLFGGSVSPLLLTAMAFERYKAIVHPLSTLGGGTKARLKWILLISWLLGSGFYIVDIITVQYHSIYGICIDKIYPWFNAKVYFTVYVTMLSIIPSIAMTGFYISAFLTLRTTDEMLENETQRARHKTRKKGLKVAILVTVIFYICCVIPSIIFGLNEFFQFFNLVRNDLLYAITSLAVTFNSAINPFIYFLFIKSFRDGFHRVFKCQRKRMLSTFTGISLSCRSVTLERTDVTDCSITQPELVAVQTKGETLEFQA